MDLRSQYKNRTEALVGIRPEEVNGIKQDLLDNTNLFITTPEDIAVPESGAEANFYDLMLQSLEEVLEELRSQRYEADLFLNKERYPDGRPCFPRANDLYGETSLEKNFDLLFKFTRRNFIAISAAGDGRCLLNSISRALVGCECLTDRLKSLIIIEIISNIDYYFEQDETEGLPLGEFIDSTIMPLALNSREYMNGVHIRAIANVLQAPILVMNSLKPEHIEDGEADLMSRRILPKTEEKNEDARKYPGIILAWQNGIVEKKETNVEEYESIYGHLLNLENSSE